MTDAPVLDEAVHARLEVYASLLRKWNARINLVSPASLSDVHRRHFEDSLQLLSYRPPHARKWVDLGSGAGFPGLVVALALADPGLEVVLIEADQRKCAFLAAVSRETQVPVTVIAERIERAAPQCADIVSARALAPLPQLLPLVSRHIAPDGTALLLKGEGVLQEIAEARGAWQFEHELIPSRSHPGGHVLVVKELRRV